MCIILGVWVCATDVETERWDTRLGDRRMFGCTQITDLFRDMTGSMYPCDVDGTMTD